MTTAPHDHARPGLADMRAALAAYRALLTTADLGAIHQAAQGGACPACTTVAAVTFAHALASELAGAGFVSGPLAARLLAAVTSAEADITAAGN